MVANVLGVHGIGAGQTSSLAGLTGGASGIGGFSMASTGFGSTQSIATNTGGGGLSLQQFQGLSSGAQGISSIAQGIQGLSRARDIGRSGKEAARNIASRARLDFAQRGKITGKLLAQQRARFGAAGVSPSGTSAAVQEFTSFERALQNRLILNDALATAVAVERRGRRAKKAAKRAGEIQIAVGVGGLLIGGGQAIGGA